jgi:Cft2 family RNA processing exonuclease
MMLVETDAGLYCPEGDFYIDPWGTVPRAVITHAHGDHARPGSAAYLCAEACRPLLARRLEPGTPIETLPYGEVQRIGDVALSFHPAGHILGSAQVRLDGRMGSGSFLAITNGRLTRPARPFNLSRATRSSPNRPSDCPFSGGIRRRM